MINIENRGKNLLKTNIKFIGNISSSYSDRDWAYVASNYGYAKHVNNNTIFFTHTYVSAYTDIAFEEIPLMPNTTYKLSFNVLENMHTKITLWLYKKDKKYNRYIGSIMEDTSTGQMAYTFTTQENEYYLIIDNEAFKPYANCLIKDFMFYKSIEDKEYTPPKQDNLQLNTELFGYKGIFDEYLGNGKVLRRWKKQIDLSSLFYYLNSTKTTVYNIRCYKPADSSSNGASNIVITGNGVILPYGSTYSGNDAIQFFWDSSALWLNLLKSEVDAEAGSSTNEKIINYLKKMELIYQLATPTIEDIEVTDNLGALTEEDNYFVYNSLSEYKFLANGINNTYSLPTTDTNYDVYVSGKLITEDITKGATSVTFSLPPRNGKVIKIVYNKESTLNCYATAELLEPVGSPETFDYFSNLSVTEVVAENNRATKSGLVKNTVKNKHYEINITVDMFDDAQQFVEKWQNKKFQLTIQHGDRSEVFAPCEIIDNVTDDYWNSEATTIRILAQSKYWVS